MINLISGFQLSTRDPVDNRILLSKEEMKTVNDNQMPDKYFAVCKDDGLLYTYDKHKVISEENLTGKFTVYSNSKIESVSINGKVIPIGELNNVDIPLMGADTFGVAKSGKGLKSEAGILSIDFNAVDDKSIPFNKVDFGSLVLDAND